VTKQCCSALRRRSSGTGRSGHCTYVESYEPDAWIRTEAVTSRPVRDAAHAKGERGRTWHSPSTGSHDRCVIRTAVARVHDATIQRERTECATLRLRYSGSAEQKCPTVQRRYAPLGGYPDDARPIFLRCIGRLLRVCSRPPPAYAGYDFQCASEAQMSAPENTTLAEPMDGGDAHLRHDAQ